VNPLSEKHKSARYSQSRTDTLIGADARIRGDIVFTGVLRIDGDIIGAVSCGDDTQGTVVVGKSGRVTGALNAPHIVVIGHVCGPIDSSASVEIHPDARVVGDASYRDIMIHEGGVIEGVLTPKFPTQEDRLGRAPRVQSLEPTAINESDEPAAEAVAQGHEIGKRPGKGRKFGVVIALLVAVLIIVWLSRSPTVVTPPVVVSPVIAPPVVDAMPKVDTPRPENPAPASAPVESAPPLVSPNAVAASAVAPVSSSQTVTKNAVQATVPDTTELDPTHVVVVQGDDPSKPGDFVYVISKESAVLFKKQRKDSAAGTRIELAQGTNKRIALAKDDILRVEQGRGLQMFYQGRKVASATIDSGAWISFMPNSRSGASHE
jgi:cytoskeletal protein CcmA (bactofilin family)